MTEERLKHLDDISGFVYGKNVGAPKEGNIIYEEIQPQILDNSENKDLEESSQEVETHGTAR